MTGRVWVIVAAVIGLFGIAFSILNLEQVTLLLGFGSVTLPLGLLVLLSLFAGALSGGLLLWAAVILPLRLRLRACEKREILSGNAP
jgi:uncharacterized integral membrane protein